MDVLWTRTTRNCWLDSQARLTIAVLVCTRSNRAFIQFLLLFFFFSCHTDHSEIFVTGLFEFQKALCFCFTERDRRDKNADGDAWGSSKWGDSSKRRDKSPDSWGDNSKRRDKSPDKWASAGWGESSNRRDRSPDRRDKRVLSPERRRRKSSDRWDGGSGRRDKTPDRWSDDDGRRGDRGRSRDRRRDHSSDRRHSSRGRSADRRSDRRENSPRNRRRDSSRDRSYRKRSYSPRKSGASLTSSGYMFFSTRD